MEAAVARRMWMVGEPIHALTYFAQESFDAWAAAGIRGFWRGYFATRAAPFGSTGPELVTATFYGFEPAMVAKALPSVWDQARPAAALEARLIGMDGALRAVLGAALDDPALTRVVDVLRAAVDAAPLGGRPLFAANVALPWPEPTHLALWHGLTCLREQRGDSHVAALVAADVDGCQAHILAGAAGGSPRETIQPTRGWSDEQWDGAMARLAARGILAADGAITSEGIALHRAIETRTDELAVEPWAPVGAEATAAVAAALLPLARRIQAAGIIRQPNPMGLPPLD